MLPFGGHFVKNCLTSLEVYLVEDPRLHLSETRYGVLLSMTSLPNFFIPFLGGVFLDKRGHRFATLLFLFLVLIGQIIFTIAIQLGDFQLGTFRIGLPFFFLFFFFFCGSTPRHNARDDVAYPPSQIKSYPPTQP